MTRVRTLLAALLFGTGALRAQGAPPDAPQVYLMTIGVGASIDARFGHNALWVHDSARGRDTVYNFGTFNWQDPLFVPHFIQGSQLYWLDVGPLDWTIDAYRRLGRSMVVQELNLPPGRRAELVFWLEQNALPENRSYRYDYYRDNCATRVRDLLDRITDGALRRATAGQPAQGTLRFHTQRSLTNNAFFYFGIMALMGPSTDAPLDQWDEMFLPEKIQEQVRTIVVPGPDGTSVPLVKDEQTILPLDLYHADAAPPSWGPGALAAGIVLGLLILMGMAQGIPGTIGRGVTRAWLLACGLGGVLLAYVWLGTNHVAAADNRNLLLLTPLALPLLAQVRGAGREKTGRFFRLAFAGSIGVGTLLALIPSLGMQWNLQLAALVVPPSIAALVVTSRPRAAAPPSPR